MTGGPPAEERSPLVSAIVVLHNGAPFLETCLGSLLRQTHRPLEIVAVDNASTDGSPELIASRFPTVRLLQAERNHGFAGGANRGIDAARGDYLFLLNQDAEAEADCVARLVALLEAQGEAAAAAPKTLMLPSRSVLHSCGIVLTAAGCAWDRGVGEPDDGRYDRPEEVFGASAGAALYRAAAVREIGGFDEDYFMYYEDLDLAWRLRLGGHTALYLPSARAYHRFGGSLGKGLPQKRLVERNRLVTLCQDAGFGQLVRALPRILRHDLRRLRWARRAGRPAEVEEALVHLQAWRQLLAKAPRLLAKRRRVQSSRRVPHSALERFFSPGFADPPYLLPTYQIVDRQTFRPGTGTELIMVEEESGRLGSGWSAPEAHRLNGEPCFVRYCGVEALVHLDRPPGRSWLYLEALGCPPPLALALELDGHHLGRLALPPGSYTGACFPLPDGPPQAATVRLRLERTWVPHDWFRNGDMRPLGAKIHRIALGAPPGAAARLGPGDFLYLGEGWTEREADARSPFRYTAERATFLLCLSPEHRVFYVCLSGGPRKAAAELSLDGQPLGRASAAAGQETTVELPLPRPLVGRAGPVQGEMRVAECWVPDQFLRNGDLRRLGLRVRELGFR